MKVSRRKNAIIVDSGYWKVRHNLKAGGCWDSITFAKGSGKNLLAGAVNCRSRILDPHPTSDGSSMLFFDQSQEKNPTVEVEQLANGDVVVTATGELRDPAGASLGTRFRHRWEYRRWGLVACELELDFVKERDDIVEIKAIEMPLRDGITHAYVRPHPVEASSSDLLGGGKWLDLGSSPYASRYIPIHVVAFEKGVEGIEFFPASNLDAWDKSLNSERGIALANVAGGPSQPGAIELSPYCAAYRRNPTRLKGKYTFRYYLSLPFIKDADTVHSKYFHVGTGSRWASDEDIRQLSSVGTRLLRFHNDYREDGPFWHDGMYPPYDLQGMTELRRVVKTAQASGMKCVPYISVKELHPQSPGFKENQAAWQREAGPTYKELHTWAGSGEFGQVMCLESGWLNRRKSDIETILKDIPWDGLYFDWCTPHPCRNPSHLGGVEYHTDADAYVDFMFWCRDRVGKDGVIFSHMSGLPYIFVENMSTLLFIYEDIGGNIAPNPDSFPLQCRFIPIAPRHLVGGPGDKLEARKFVVGGILEGHPPCFFAPLGAPSQPLMEEAQKLKDVDLGKYRFTPASQRPVQTGHDGVFACLWHGKADTVVYIANLTPKPARGKARVVAGGSRKTIAYSLPPWGTMVKICS